MMLFFRRIAAFVRRDFCIASSYKLQFLVSICSAVFILAIFYFVSKLVKTDALESLQEQYGADFFSFALIGVAATGFLHVGVVGFAEKLRISMTEGSLEMMFVSPVSAGWILIMPCVWSFLFEGVRAMVLIFFGVFLFGAEINLSSFHACALVLLLTLTSNSVFGLLSASIILIVKRGDPIAWAFMNASALVAGAYFPIEMLPGWLAWIPRLLPMTYAYRGARITLLTGGGISDVAGELLVLLAFSVIGLPLALFACSRAVGAAKRDGSLGSF